MLSALETPTSAWYLVRLKIKEEIIMISKEKKAQIIAEQYKRSPSFTSQNHMNELYAKIHRLGYRKMPTDMYLNWLYSLNEYSNEFRI